MRVKLVCVARCEIALFLVSAVMLTTGCALNSGAGHVATDPIASTSTTTNLATAKTPPPPRLADERGAKVALLLPLSAAGQTAAIAKGMKQAAELALFDSGSTTVQLIVKDDLGTPEGAQAAAEDAVRDGAELIVGPLFAASAKAVAPIALRANIPVLAFSNDTQVAGGGVYLMSFLVTQDIDRIVAYSVSRGHKRFAALLPDDAYGRVMGDAFRKSVASHGGNVKAFETYPIQANAMLDPVRKLVEAIKRADEDGESVDALFVPGSADTLSSLGPLLSYAGLDPSRVKVIGTGAWDQTGVGRESSFIGGWFPAPEPHGWQAFSEKFGRTYGSAPPRIATLSYDAMSVALQLSSNDKGHRYTISALTRGNGFAGSDGPVRFRPDGTADRGLAILEVQKLGATIIDPAPTNFGATPGSSPGGVKNQ